jgi:hypothetical protein
MSDKVEWFVRGHKQGVRGFADEVPLKSITVEKLREIFHQPADEPMYDVFPIGEREAEALRPFMDRAVDVTTMKYFLYCDAVE